MLRTSLGCIQSGNHCECYWAKIQITYQLFYLRIFLSMSNIHSERIDISLLFIIVTYLLYKRKVIYSREIEPHYPVVRQFGASRDSPRRGERLRADDL